MFSGSSKWIVRLPPLIHGVLFPLDFSNPLKDGFRLPLELFYSPFEGRLTELLQNIFFPE
jgi:hypothetical protein